MTNDAGRRGVLGLIGLMCVPCLAAAQSRDSIADVSLEDLMDVEVISASRREQPLHEIPSAVFVMTRDDIRRMGASTLAELMRGVPGLDVSRAGANRWAVSARGFNAQFANKMQVLVDGRSVYTPLFSGVYWDTLDIMPDDIERIEVIRGPGAAIWGANAVNGVVNIITRSAAETQGQMVTTSFGGDDRWTISGRSGGTVGSRGYYRLYGRHASHAGILDAQGYDANDPWRLHRGGGRVDYALDAQTQVMVQGDIYSAQVSDVRVISVLTPPFQSHLSSDIRPAGGHVLARWTQRSAAETASTLVAYWDRMSRPGASLPERRSNLGVEWQRTFRSGGHHQWIVGTEYRRSQDEVGGSEIISLADPSRTDHYVTAFAQDEISMRSRPWRLTLGSKLEHNPYTGIELQPSARLAWVPNQRRTYWAGASRAVRRPSRADDGVRFTAGVLPTQPLITTLDVRGADTLDAEVVVAYEGGTRWRPTSWFAIDVSAFANRYTRLIGALPGTPVLVAGPQPYLSLPLLTTNAFGAQSHGLEILTRWQLPRVRVTASYSYLSLRSTDATSGPVVTVNDLGTNPTHQASIRSGFDLPVGLEADTLLHYVSSLDQGRVPNHLRLDVRLGWRARNHMDVAVGLRNALDPHYVESVELLGWPAGRVPRRAFAELRWWF